MRNVSEILQNLFTGNINYLKTRNEDYFVPFRDSQNPGVVLLTCSDSRVQTSIFGIDSINEIFVVRNIGNQILSVFGSIDYAVYNLKTPVLAIMGHSHCGAIKAVFSNYEDQPFDIIRELDHLSIPIRHIKHRKHHFEEEWLRITEQNIDYQVKLAVKKYHNLIDENKLVVIGIVDDFANQYQTGNGRLVIINVNGCKEPEINKANPFFNFFDEDLKNQIFRRAKLHKNESANPQ
ncbi:MAG: carbonic anhydrase [Bacteroidales bacterium]